MKRVLGRLARWLGLILLAFSILLIGAWCALAVWFRGIGNEPVRDVLAGTTFVLALVTVGCLTTSWRWRGFAFYAAVVAVVLVWWSTIHPSNDRDWTPDVARSVTGTTDGDRVVINNVRDFTWRSDTDFDPRWEQRTYNLSHLTNVDLIMSYWGNEAIAHTIISFGFDDDSRLAFSIETRKERGEAYSSIAGFFKQYDLAIVAADERDIVRVRSNVRGEDVQIYRLRMTPANAQVLFREYVDEANDLARAPRALRALRLFRSYRVASRMRHDFPFVRRNYETIIAGTHLFVFLFVMTAVVYETQYRNNPEISNYIDALYFAVATLTTTGFGDITLPGRTGRLLAIIMMVVGVSLFMRMVQVLLRPSKAHHRCSYCGLSEHERDAIFCKRCGTLLSSGPKTGPD